jgi:hypothetical protein
MCVSNFTLHCTIGLETGENNVVDKYEPKVKVINRQLACSSYWLAVAQQYMSSELLDKELRSQRKDKTEYQLDSAAQGMVTAITSFLNYTDDVVIFSHHIDLLRRMRVGETLQEALDASISLCNAQQEEIESLREEVSVLLAAQEFADELRHDEIDW